MEQSKVLVIGLGLSGKAAVRFLLRRKAVVTAVDVNIDVVTKNAEVEQLRILGAHICLQDKITDVSAFDTIVLSPGIPPTNPLCVMAQKAGILMIGEAELALREVKIPCIGITGTNGKTTVTLLTTHVLNFCGKKAMALGNVGVALADGVDTLLEEKCQYAVVELSSFQIDTLHFPCLDVAVLLNITPDHLDRYGTMEAYALSKARIASLVRKEGSFYLFDECQQQYPDQFKLFRVELFGYTPSCSVYAKNGAVFCAGKSAFVLPEKNARDRSHDIENMMASFAICHRYGVTGAQFREALETFQKPHHRIEFVTKVDDVEFYDDSKGTNIDAVIRAVEVLQGQGKIVLIAGGVDKGSPYEPWIPVFRNKVRSICAIGEASPKIQRELGGHYPVTLHQSLEDAVRHAFTNAQPGDQILLSPGCSSYDMFKDYVQRGNEFQRIANCIREERK